jgi:hypothetical protein
MIPARGQILLFPGTTASREPFGFAEFWRMYPKKRARGDARAAWLRAIRIEAPAAILIALERYPFGDEQFIPHPARWLAGECWADEFADATATLEPRQQRSDAEWVEWATAGNRPSSLVRVLLAGMPAALALWERGQRENP